MVAGAALLVACGDDEEVAETPPRVDVALAPPELEGNLKLYENTAEETVAAFANVGETSLLADGRIWELRRADRLVGTLQISTVLPRVELTDQDVRESMVRHILSGAVERIRIDDVEVYTTLVNDKAVFLWFGANVYEVLQLKDAKIEDYEAVAAQIIRHQATVPSWLPLPDSIGVQDEETET